MTSEFDRQLATLIARGYPRLAGLSEAAFTRFIEPLRDLAPSTPSDDGRIPFVIVVPGLVSPEQAMHLVELGGKPGFVDMTSADPLDRFLPIDGVEIPPASAYLITNVDTGKDMLNVTPDEALTTIREEGRSPLTIDEGIAVLTHFPDVLTTHNAFSLLGSRSGDRRVPALWLSKGRPRLGWCWAGNPHTWLGSASCSGRVGATTHAQTTLKA
jgi:hypothetical protein